eukprot:GDKJ01015138.1.p1 GENE.GDKJ01015138.1~~GDKJ01015138.1.p1  ORF type:complete len:311 (+),score=16.59 GDKJ01015138.1:44-976(+)
MSSGSLLQYFIANICLISFLYFTVTAPSLNDYDIASVMMCLPMIFLSFWVFFLFHIVSCSNPGYYIANGYYLNTYCARCEHGRPVRTHHCASCNRCITLYDHHCAFVNNCIGGENRRIFMQLIATVWLMLLTTILTCLSLIVYHSSKANWEIPHGEELFSRHSYFVVVFVVGMLAFVYFLFFDSFARYHWNLTRNGLTTLDDFLIGQQLSFAKLSSPQEREKLEQKTKKDYDLGSFENNWMAVMGKNKVGWFLPVFGEDYLPFCPARWGVHHNYYGRKRRNGSLLTVPSDADQSSVPLSPTREEGVIDIV